MEKTFLTILGRKFNRIFYIDLNRDYKNSILLVGSGRSGTTWLSDIINYRNEYRYIFEPCHPQKVAAAKTFGNRKYIRKDDKNPQYFEAANKIFSGEIRNFWADNFNAKYIANKRLIKTIRMPLMVHWIYENFPSMPIICLVRHPIPTALSAVKFNLFVRLEDFLSQEELVSDYLLPFMEPIKKAIHGDEFEKHLYAWCIENYVMLKQINDINIHLIFYEELCIEPETEIKKIFNYLGKEFDDKVLELISRPSTVSRGWSAVKKGTDLLHGWRKEVERRQMDKAIEILKLFGLEKLYCEDSMPKKDFFVQHSMLKA